VSQAAELLDALAEYRYARLRLLQLLNVPVSNRDPLSEFAERLVAALSSGVMAENRNQPAWDVRLPDGATVQVKYLANPATGRWVNEHPVRRIVGADWYAIVLIEDFAVTGVLMFPCSGLAPIGAALNKRGALALEAGWDLTRVNWVAIRDQPDRFRALGMRVLLPPEFKEPDCVDFAPRASKLID
jgi:hypothetical protein